MDEPSNGFLVHKCGAHYNRCGLSVTSLAKHAIGLWPTALGTDGITQQRQLLGTLLTQPDFHLPADGAPRGKKEIYQPTVDALCCESCVVHLFG